MFVVLYGFWCGGGFWLMFGVGVVWLGTLYNGQALETKSYVEQEE